jgi:hypothetical protein
MGIYFLVHFAPSLLYLLQFLTIIIGNQELWIKVLASLMMILLPTIWIGFCIVVIVKSDWMAHKLIRHDSSSPLASNLCFQDFQILGYNLIGILLIVESFPQIISCLTTFAVQLNLMNPYSTKVGLDINILPRLITFLAQILLGLILFLKPHGLANLWKRLQTDQIQKALDDGSLKVDDLNDTKT